MTLTELTTAVYAITNRPDLVTETFVAIQAATLKAHQSDYYWKDIFETGLTFSTADYNQSFQYRSTIPLWRSSKYIRKYPNSTELNLAAQGTSVNSLFATYSNPVSGVPGYDGTNVAQQDLKLIEVENFRDYFHVQKLDVYYLAGANMQIRTHNQEQNYLLGCYLNPNITSAGFNSWVALDHPFAIIYEASATVFKMIGKDDEASAYRTILMPEQIAMLKTSNVVGNGF
jgi:hypothetical protein